MNPGKLVKVSVYPESLRQEVLFFLHFDCTADISGSTEKRFYETPFVGNWCKAGELNVIPAPNCFMMNHRLDRLEKVLASCNLYLLSVLFK